MAADDEKESFAALFEREKAAPRRRALRVGDRLEAVVIQIGHDAVFVELDGKQQAFLDAEELRAADGTMTVREGDRVTAHVIEVDDVKGIVRLARTVGKGGGVAGLERAKEAGLPVDGKVTGVNK